MKVRKKSLCFPLEVDYLEEGAQNDKENADSSADVHSPSNLSVSINNQLFFCSQQVIQFVLQLFNLVLNSERLHFHRLQVLLSDHFRVVFGLYSSLHPECVVHVLLLFVVYAHLVVSSDKRSELVAEN